MIPFDKTIQSDNNPFTFISSIYFKSLAKYSILRTSPQLPLDICKNFLNITLPPASYPFRNIIHHRNCRPSNLIIKPIILHSCSVQVNLIYQQTGILPNLKILKTPNRPYKQFITCK